MSRPDRVFLWLVIFYTMIYSRARLENIKPFWVVRLSLGYGLLNNSLGFSYLYYYIMTVVCNNFFKTPLVVNAFTNSSRVILGGSVGNNIVYTLSHIAKH